MTDVDLSALTNRQIVLARRPEGLVSRDDFDLVDGVVPEPAEGEAVVRTLCLGIDATVRTWLNKGEGYLPAVEIGEVVRCSGVGRTVASRSPKFPVGGLVYGLPGWQEYSLARDDGLSTPIGTEGDPAAMLSVLGATGLTAYFGLTEVGEAKAGETVVVSAAGGATGSAVVQIAKILGCRVVGIAGTDEKCAWVVDELGADACINYRTEDVPARLRELCPKRIDVYFDNVGGDILDAALGALAQHGRVALCGAISVYNESGRPPGPSNYLNLISRRGKMQGFISLDWWDRFGEATEQLKTWVDEGKLHYRIHWFHGLRHAPEALNAMFTGENVGKILIEVAKDE
jgi:NADPH-dependent curcumin reductase CurA